nr:NAD(P)-binding protein [Acinetobacter puyangensis]
MMIMQNKNTTLPIIVIGAGIAGLACARTLHKQVNRYWLSKRIPGLADVFIRFVRMRILLI